MKLYDSLNPFKFKRKKMQKVTVLICLLFLVFSAAHAQKTFLGVTAGYNYVQINTSSNVAMDPTFGETIGLSLFNIKKNNWETVLDFVIEKYHYQGFTRITYGFSVSDKASIDPISTLISFSAYKCLDVKKHFKLGAGFWMSTINNDHKYPAYPSHYFNSPDKANLDYNTEQLFDTNLSPFLPFLSDFGPSFEALFCINQRLNFGLKYKIGFKNLYHANDEVTWKQNYLSLNVNYYPKFRHTSPSIFIKKPSESFKN